MAFRNCIVNGMVLAEDGRKMSKRLKNYPEPSEVLDKFGGDAVRAYLINSPVLRADACSIRGGGCARCRQDRHPPAVECLLVFHDIRRGRWFHSRGPAARHRPVDERPEMDRWVDQRAAVSDRRHERADGGLLPALSRRTGARLRRGSHELVRAALEATFLAGARRQ